jgi:hypothetical protein
MLATSDRFGWTTVPLSPHFRSDVPWSPGLYAVLDIPRAAGLPTGASVLYVGRSLILRRRLDDHLSHFRAHNPQVARLPHDGSLEFWFKQYDREEIADAERVLIRSAQPKLNSIRYGDRDHGDQEN